MIPDQWLREARQRITPYIRQTPLTYDSKLNIYLKWENHQVTGSFKARGAFNKILNLQHWERQQGLVAASAGNHGQGVAAAGNIYSSPVTLFASEHAPAVKLDAMRQLGAQVMLVPGGYGEAEKAGLAYAFDNHQTWISPYNDGQVIAGQGTLGLEVIEQLSEQLEALTWVVPVGGGGLLAGIGSALRTQPTVGHRLVGVQSEASAFFYKIYHEGTQTGVDEFPSLADGLAGPVEEGSLTIPMLRNLANQFELVTENQISHAIAYAYSYYNEIIEGSAATALAAVLSGIVNHRPAVVILSGGNIQPELHQDICQHWATSLELAAG